MLDPHVSTTGDPLMIHWRRYVRGLAVEFDPSLGISTPEWQRYEIQTRAGVRSVRSMLSLYEIALLYSAADYRGEGAIVDGGPLLGVGTFALAKGTTDSGLAGRQQNPIWAFDLWLRTDLGDTVGGLGEQTGSVFDDFLDLNREFLDLIHCCPGDITTLHWAPKPIEVHRPGEDLGDQSLDVAQLVRLPDPRSVGRHPAGLRPLRRVVDRGHHGVLPRLLRAPGLRVRRQCRLSLRPAGGARTRGGVCTPRFRRQGSAHAPGHRARPDRWRRFSAVAWRGCWARPTGRRRCGPVGRRARYRRSRPGSGLLGHRPLQPDDGCRPARA